MSRRKSFTVGLEAPKGIRPPGTRALETAKWAIAFDAYAYGHIISYLRPKRPVPDDGIDCLSLQTHGSYGGHTLYVVRWRRLAMLLTLKDGEGDIVLFCPEAELGQQIRAVKDELRNI